MFYTQAKVAAGREGCSPAPVMIATLVQGVLPTTPQTLVSSQLQPALSRGHTSGRLMVMSPHAWLGSISGTDVAG